MNKQSIRYTAGFLLLMGLAYTLIPALSLNPAKFVTYDFLAYHTSFLFFMQGNNPFDEAAILQYQLAIPFNHDFLPARMYYGPWTFIIMFPFLIFDLETSATLWFFFSLSLVFISSVIAWTIFNPKSKRYGLAMIWGSLFYANIDCLQWNQMGIFLTFCCCAFLWAIDKEKDLLAGLALVPLSIKPHLFFIFGITYFIWVAKTKRLRSLYAAAGGFVFLLAVSTLVFPDILSLWLERSETPPVFLATPTIAGAMRFFAAKLGMGIITWPLYVVPSVATLLWLLFLSKRQWRIDLKELTPLSLIIGIAACPYANLHDQTLLITAQLFLIAKSYGDKYSDVKRLKLQGLLLAIQCLAIASNVIGYNQSWNKFWIPIALLAIWYYFAPKKKPYLLH